MKITAATFPIELRDKVERKIKRAISPYIRVKTSVCVLDVTENNSSPDFIYDTFQENVTDDESKYKMAIVNYAWHSSDKVNNFTQPDDDTEFIKELDKFHDGEGYHHRFYYEGLVPFNKEFVLKNEKVLYDSEGKYMIMSLVKVEDLYILYIGWDFLGTFIQEDVNFFRYWMDKFIKDVCQEPIFLEKFATSFGKKQIKPEEIKFCKSILEKASEEYPDEEARQPLYDEMIDKVLDKNFIDTVNSIILSYRKEHVTKEEARKYLEHWAKAKWPIYLMFGRNLILKTTSRQKPDRQAKIDIVNSIMNKYPKYALMFMEVPMSDIINNNMKHCIGRLENYCTFKSGMKFSKFMSTLCNDKELDVDISSIYQEKETDVQLFVSIHPMDYLTMSLSKSGWTSCHNAWGGGWGNAASGLMTDDATVVTYSSNANYKYNKNNREFTWNSKNWRMLCSIGVEQNSMILHREYPQDYYNGNSRKAVMDMIINYICKYVNTVTDATVTEKQEDGPNIIKRYYELGEGHTHYDDLSSRHVFHVALERPKNYRKKIVVGHFAYCPICGERNDSNSRIVHIDCRHKP